MRATQAVGLLNPENFQDPNTAPNGHANEFAELRQRISEMERAEQGVPSAPQARDAAGAGVTAAVTTRRGRRKAAQAQTSPPVERSNRPMSNAPTFQELLNKAVTLGADKGNGQDAQAKYAMMVFEAAYLGSLSLERDKHGKDRRDGIVLSEAYVKGRTGATIFDTKSDSGRKLISNTDKMIKLGTTPKWGPGQPLQNINDLMTFRQREKKAGRKVDDAYNMLMRYATQQLKADTLISGVELQSFVYRKDGGGPVTAEDVLERVRRILSNLKLGKVSNCADLDSSKEVADAIKLMTKRLQDVAKARGGVTAPQPAQTATAATAAA